MPNDHEIAAPYSRLGIALLWASLIAGDLYLAWLVASDRVIFWQAMLMIAAATCTASLIGLLATFSTWRVFGKRLRAFVMLCGGMCLVLGFELMTTMPATLTDQSSDQPIFRVGEAIESVWPKHHRTLYLIFFGLTLGVQACLALTSPDSRRWWYRNVITQKTSMLMALVVSVLVAFGIASVADEVVATSIGVETVLILFFTGHHLFLIYRSLTPMTQQDQEAAFARYRAGLPATPKDDDSISSKRKYRRK